MEKAKNKPSVVDTIENAFDAPKGSKDNSNVRRLRERAVDASKLLQDRKDKVIGVGTALIIFAIFQSLQFLPEYTREFFLQKKDLLVTLNTGSALLGLIEGWILIRTLSDLRKPMQEIRNLCILLGLQEVDTKEVLREMDLKTTEMIAEGYARINLSATETPLQNKLDLTDDPNGGSDTDTPVSNRERAMNPPKRIK